MIDFNKDVMPLKDKLYRLALRLLQNDAEAQDITQETLIRLWARLSQLDSAGQAEATGLTISHNLALDALKRAGRNYEQIEAQHENFAPDRSLSAIDTLAAQDRRDFVRRLIDSLPPKQRAVVQLRDIEGKSYREIAEILQLSEEQVKITLFRARQSLKRHFQNSESHEL